MRSIVVFREPFDPRAERGVLGRTINSYEITKQPFQNAKRLSQKMLDNLKSSTMLFAIQNSFRTYALSIALMILVSGLTFGSLYDHLFDAFDDKEHLEDIKTGLEDPMFLFSSDRILPIRPLNDLVVMVGYTLWGDNPQAFHLVSVSLHTLAAIVLIFILRQMGVDIELQLLSSLLFLVNVAHFRAVHWIICMDRILALLWGFGVIACYLRFRKTGSPGWMVATLCLMPISVFSHPTAVSIAGFCTYYAWRNGSSIIKALKETWSILLVAGCSGLLAYFVSPDHNQTQGLVNTPEPIRLIMNLFWFSGRLLTGAHWLPDIALMGHPNMPEIAIGALICVVLGIMAQKREPLVSDWAAWILLALLPFINHPITNERWLPVGPSRQLYLPSAGASVLLAWFLREGIRKLFIAQRIAFKRSILVVTFILLTLSSIEAHRNAEAITYYLSGRRYFAQGDFETGIDRMTRAYLRNPKIVPFDLYDRLATVCFSLGKSPRIALETARTIYPDSTLIEVYLEISRATPEESSQSIGIDNRHLTQLLKRGNSNTTILRQATSRALMNLGGFWHENHDYNKAIIYYQNAISLNPGYAMAFYNLGNAFAAKGQMQEAAQAYETAIKKNPGYISPLQNLANILYANGHVDEAIPLFRRLCRQMPQNSDMLFNLGIALQSKGELEEAAHIFQQAIEITPDDPELHQLLGDTQQKMGRYKDSILSYKRALALGAFPSKIHLKLGILHFENASYMEAKKALEKAGELSPEDPQIKSALAQIHDILSHNKQRVPQPDN